MSFASGCFALRPGLRSQAQVNCCISDSSCCFSYSVCPQLWPMWPKCCKYLLNFTSYRPCVCVYRSWTHAYITVVVLNIRCCGGRLGSQTNNGTMALQNLHLSLWMIPEHSHHLKSKSRLSTHLEMDQNPSLRSDILERTVCDSLGSDCSLKFTGVCTVTCWEMIWFDLFNQVS